MMLVLSSPLFGLLIAMIVAATIGEVIPPIDKNLFSEWLLCTGILNIYFIGRIIKKRLTKHTE